MTIVRENFAPTFLAAAHAELKIQLRKVVDCDLSYPAIIIRSLGDDPRGYDLSKDLVGFSNTIPHPGPDAVDCGSCPARDRDDRRRHVHRCGGANRTSRSTLNETTR
jgi:hypothetical protein